MTNATQHIKRHTLFGLLATLFVASTVWIKTLTAPNPITLDFHACYATNCPVCGSQYQAQFETERLQKGIALDSDSICQSLEVAYQNTWLNIDFPHQRSEWLVILDCQSSPSLSPASTPLRI
jgi:hypothetical protein